MKQPLRSYRTLFLSDLHLGSPHSQAARLLAFLRGVYFDKLCLVGDVFDSPGISLPQAHRDVIELVLRRMRDGVTVVYVPGNHDVLLRSFVGEYGNLEIVISHDHVTLDGKRVLLIHGDELDIVATSSWLHRIDRWLPIPFWEMLRRYAGWLLRRQQRRFERKALEKLLIDHDHVLMGHTHFPAMNGTYINTGDWVTHCSAVVEHYDGKLELIHG